jgi:hypothetical protein
MSASIELGVKLGQWRRRQHMLQWRLPSA